MQAQKESDEIKKIMKGVHDENSAPAEIDYDSQNVIVIETIDNSSMNRINSKTSFKGTLDTGLVPYVSINGKVFEKYEKEVTSKR